MTRVKSSTRLLYARMTTMAIGNLARFCWNSMLLSAVSKTSKLFDAVASSLPFFKPAQPSRRTELQVWG